MTGFSDYGARKVLDHLVGKTAFPMPSVYVGLFTGAPTDAGGGTEVTGGGYARAIASGAAWAASGGTAPVASTNITSITFPISSAGWGNVLAWGLFDAATGGNLLFWDYMGLSPWRPFACAVGSPAVITSPSHGFLAGDSVVATAEFGGTLPVQASAWGGLHTVASPTTDTFTVGITTTGTGDGMIRRVVPQTVASGFAPSFAAGVLTLSLV